MRFLSCLPLWGMLLTGLLGWQTYKSNFDPKLPSVPKVDIGALESGFKLEFDKVETKYLGEIDGLKAQIVKLQAREPETVTVEVEGDWPERYAALEAKIVELEALEPEVIKEVVTETIEVEVDDGYQERFLALQSEFDHFKLNLPEGVETVVERVIDTEEVERLQALLRTRSTELDSLRTKTANLAELERIQRSYDTLKGDIALLREENSSLKQQVASFTDNSARISALTTERDQLLVDLDAAREIEANLSAVTFERDTLRAQLDTARGHEERIAALTSQRDQLLVDLDTARNNVRTEVIREPVDVIRPVRERLFARLSEVVGGNGGVHQSRFYMSSNVAFKTGSSELAAGGRNTLDNAAAVLIDYISGQPETDFQIEVSGHTDKRPIRTARFPSNWELSAARASEAVRYLVSRGVPADRMVATGYAETRPLDTRETAEAYALNRRIEFEVAPRSY